MKLEVKSLSGAFTFLLGLLVLFACPHQSLAQALTEELFISLSNAQHSELVFNTKPEALGCEFGYLDEFLFEREQGPKSFRLILTFEALVGDSERRFVDLTAFNLEKEFHGRVKLNTDSGRLYRLAVCSDWSRSDSCSTKPAVNLIEFFQGQNLGAKKLQPPAEKRTDERYYETLLLIENGEFKILRPQPNIPALKSFLARFKLQKSVLDDLLKGQAQFSSTPAIFAASKSLNQDKAKEVEPRGLELKLGYRDLKACVE